MARRRVGDPDLMASLTASLAERLGSRPGTSEAIGAELDKKVANMITLVCKYMDGGSHNAALKEADGASRLYEKPEQIRCAIYGGLAWRRM